MMAYRASSCIEWHSNEETLKSIEPIPVSSSVVVALLGATWRALEPKLQCSAFFFPQPSKIFHDSFQHWSYIPNALNPTLWSLSASCLMTPSATTLRVWWDWQFDNKEGKTIDSRVYTTLFAAYRRLIPMLRRYIGDWDVFRRDIGDWGALWDVQLTANLTLFVAFQPSSSIFSL